MNPFSSARPASGDADGFDEVTDFVPEHIPEPGPFLEDHDVLVDDAHGMFHETTRDLFEERGVYDATFGYNLARLNLDRRHPDAGFRYAVDADDPAVLRAEFTPTTEFCPQADALVRGAFRAWNALGDRHEYDLVRVRVHPSHHQGEFLNDSLENVEREYLETGELPGESDADDSADPDDATPESPF